MSRATIERKLLAIWYPGVANSSKPNVLVKLLLSILSKIYYLVIKLRRTLFKLKFFKSYRAAVPVIIVGNITVGGTGKTSFVIALAQHLALLGLRPGIITRGYQPANGSKTASGYKAKPTKSLLLTKDNDSRLSCEQTGDEAQLLHNNTGLPVAINRDRAQAVKDLLANNLCNIVLSDDGLQHYKLERDLEICLVDGARMFGNNKLLPAGPLRETSRRLDSVDFLLLKDHGFNIIAKSLVNLATNSEVVFEDFGSLLNSDMIIHAYAGLGNNDSFFSLLHNVLQKGCDTETRFVKHHFSDHYIYQHKDFELLQKRTSAGQINRDIIITTEKDAVKIKDLLKDSKTLSDIYFLKIDTKLHQDFLLNFDIKLKQIAEQYSLNHKPLPAIEEVDYVR